MLRIASCLLLAVTTLQAHRTSHSHIRPETYATSGAVYPMDYNDELTIKNPLVHPDANIIFSFSQTRRDQPPLLDNREERLGKYMYRSRKSSTTTTTSTTPAPAETTTKESGSESEESGETVALIFEPEHTMPVKQEVLPEEVKPESIQIQPIRQYQQNVPEEIKPEPVQPAQQLETVPEEKREPMPARRHHGRVSMRPTMLPTGLSYKQPISSFRDFDSELEVPDSSRIDPAARYPSVDIWQPTTKTTQSPFFTQTASTIDLNHSVLPQVTEAPKPTSHRTRGDRRHSDRSRHGHRRADVTTSPIDAVSTVSVPTMLPKLGNPPPVPTLSPWYGDSYGK